VFNTTAFVLHDQYNFSVNRKNYICKIEPAKALLTYFRKNRPLKNPIYLSANDQTNTMLVKEILKQMM
jgi:hypothetical protein